MGTKWTYSTIQRWCRVLLLRSFQRNVDSCLKLCVTNSGPKISQKKHYNILYPTWYKAQCYFVWTAITGPTTLRTITINWYWNCHFRSCSKVEAHFSDYSDTTWMCNYLHSRRHIIEKIRKTVEFPMWFVIICNQGQWIKSSSKARHPNLIDFLTSLWWILAVICSSWLYQRVTLRLLLLISTGVACRITCTLWNLIRKYDFHFKDVPLQLASLSPPLSVIHAAARTLVCRLFSSKSSIFSGLKKRLCAIFCNLDTSFEFIFFPVVLWRSFVASCAGAEIYRALHGAAHGLFF